MDQDAKERTNAIIAGLLAMLRVMADGFAALFGAPGAMASGNPIYGALRKRAVRWLHDMECVARRLLVLSAAQFKTLPAPLPPEPREPQPPYSAPPRDDANLKTPEEESAQWRVDLRVDPPRDPVIVYEFAAHRRYHNPKPPRLQLHYVDDPRPLAQRFEALLRILNDPDAYAARLALRLHNWRVRPHKRTVFLRAFCRYVPIVNEAGLPDSDWDVFGAARQAMLDILPVFHDPAPS